MNFFFKMCWDINGNLSFNLKLILQISRNNAPQIRCSINVVGFWG